MADLAQAIANLFGAPDHPVEIIGWRHGEKLFETLASAHEIAKSEDLAEYFRIPMDTRGLNYGKYYTEGNTHTAEVQEYNSHNTRRLTVSEIEALLRTLPEVEAELAEAGRA